jgi:hypothetical protein
MTKARNIADLGSNDVIETSATGVDVTGTVTADGLTVETAAGTSGTIGLLRNSSSALAGNSAYLDFKFDNTFSGNNVDVQIGAIKTNAGNEESAFVIKTTEGTGTPTERFRVEANGDVSFYEDTGTTAKFVWDASAEELEIGSSTDKLELGASFQRFRKGNENKILIGNTSSALGSGTGLINYLYDPEPFIWYQGAERMRIDSSGNVGIGTASPSTKLMLEHSNDGAVGGTIRIKDRDSQQVPGQLTGAIEFESEDATMPTSGVSTAIKAYCASTAGGSYLTLSTTDQYTSTLDERVRITDSGNVGIGDTAPERKLHVNSGSTNECALFESTDTEVTLALKDSTGTAEIKSRNDFRFNTGGSERARITTEGTFDLAYKNLGSIATYTDTTYRHRDTFANLFFTTPADNVWRNVCAMNDSYGTFTVTGSDASTGDVAQYAYRITTVSYGVSMFSQVFYKEGGWNTGTFEFRVANVGGTQTLQMRYSSYYSSSNTGSFYINFNSLGY